MSDLPSVELLEPEEDSTAAKIKELASEHVPEAVATLNKLMGGGRKISAAVRRQAANDILTQAAGRPEARRVAIDSGGLTIVINQLFGDGSKTVINSPAGAGAPQITESDVIAEFEEIED